MEITHFTLQEFLHSDTAVSCGIQNVPTWSVVNNLERLATMMEHIRNGLGGASITINSGYRGPELNAYLGGATNSAHLYGLACDFVVPEYGSPYDVCKAIEPYLPVLEVDQLIWEYDDWIHLGICAPGTEPQCQCLTINNNGTFYGIP